MIDEIMYQLDLIKIVKKKDQWKRWLYLLYLWKFYIWRA